MQYMHTPGFFKCTKISNILNFTFIIFPLLFR